MSRRRGLEYNVNTVKSGQGLETIFKWFASFFGALLVPYDIEITWEITHKVCFMHAFVDHGLVLCNEVTISSNFSVEWKSPSIHFIE